MWPLAHQCPPVYPPYPFTQPPIFSVHFLPFSTAAEQTVESQVGSLRYRLHDSVRRFWLDLRRTGAQQREAQVRHTVSLIEMSR